MSGKGLGWRTHPLVHCDPADEEERDAVYTILHNNGTKKFHGLGLGFLQFQLPAKLP